VTAHHGGATPEARFDAQLDARLATFTRYAATVSEQFSAALRGDADRARALVEERELLAEHFAELRSASAAEPGTPPFDAMLAGAIEELDHQMGIELALRQRLATLRDEALRVLHAPQGGASAADDVQAAATRAAAAALAVLDPATVSGGALASLSAQAAGAEAARVQPAPARPVEPGRPRAGMLHLDVRC
jgi:hypothetical protein